MQRACWRALSTDGDAGQCDGCVPGGGESRRRRLPRAVQQYLRAPRRLMETEGSPTDADL